ncbi:MAG TPA: hypothetical protein VHL80_09840 [Polyangia bacterium]|nr:hypothetical protein [Polyangia bacterium]
MRRILTASIFCIVVTAAVLGTARTANATEVGYARKFGLGFEIGDPTGLTAKLWVAPTNALDFGLGLWGYGFDDCAANHPCSHYGYHDGTLNMDYLWQSNIIRGQAQLDWHIGAGGRAVWFGGCNGDCVALGARMPVGVDLMFVNPSFIEVFFELAPIFYIVPGFDFGVEGALGVRFYF